MTVFFTDSVAWASRPVLILKASVSTKLSEVIDEDIQIRLSVSLLFT